MNKMYETVLFKKLGGKNKMKKRYESKVVVFLVLTRKTDKQVSLNERIAFAKERFCFSNLIISMLL